MISLAEYQPYNIELYKHQRETMEFILRNKRCFILDDMGTGKTLSSLSVCDFLMIHKKISKVLIIAPLSTLRVVWAKHIIQFFPGRKFAVLHGTKEQRKQLLAANCEFYIINTDGIKIIETELINKKFDFVIVDESTSFASHTSTRTKVMWKIAKFAKGIICMTGNPIPNNTLQSYSQAKIIHFEYPKYFTVFRDQLKIKLDMYTYIDRPEAVGLAYAVLQPSIRHKLEDCIDLPPIIYQDLEIPLTEEQRKHYIQMEKDYITWLKEGKAITAANAAVKTTKLMQISCGLIIDNDSKASAIDCGPRMAELENIIGQTNKLIIFAVFTEIVNMLVASIPGAEKIDGSVNMKKRSDIMDRFQDGDLQVLVCQPAAISHGVTLTASNTIVWWGPTFNNEHYEQCNRRIRRPSQTRPQLIIRFRGTKAENKVYNALHYKRSVSQALLEYEVED